MVPYHFYGDNMVDEQLYIFIDKTGHCFEDFQRIEVDGEVGYYDIIGAWFRGGRKFTVGDMLCFRDDLISASFKWNKDFYIKKVN